MNWEFFTLKTGIDTFVYLQILICLGNALALESVNQVTSATSNLAAHGKGKSSFSYNESQKMNADIIILLISLSLDMFEPKLSYSCRFSRKSLVSSNDAAKGHLNL